MKEMADRNRRTEEYAAGDMVYLKMRPYRHKSLAQRSNEELARHYYGPYKF